MPKKPAKTKRKTKARTARRSAPLAAPKRASAVWSIQDGKDSFSALVEAAREKPQTVTKHGKPTVVVVAVEEFERKFGGETRPKKNFVEHLLSMPQDDGEFERIPFTLRDIEF
jgi:prevent-host-death family protein